MSADPKLALAATVPVQALPAQVLRVPQGEEQVVALVLGLQWRVILGRDLVRLARDRAQELGASHWVHAGGRAESVGLLLDHGGSASSASPWPRVAYSAAQIFARLAGEGTHAAVLPLPGPGDIFWLVLVRDGAVAADGDLCLARPGVAAAWQMWQQRHGESWQVWGEPSAASLSESSAALAWNDLAAAAGAESLLQARRRSWRLRPWLLLALLVLVLGWVLWRPGQAPPNSSLKLAIEHDAELAAQAQQAWHEALETWRASTRLPTVLGLEHLAQSLLLVPAQIVGWRLERLACQQQTELWRCTAQYQRAHPLARQRGLHRALPSAWRLQWSSLEQAQAEWSVQVASAPLQWEALPALTETWLPDADHWLALQALWRRIEWGRRESLALPRPVLPETFSGMAVAKEVALGSQPLPTVAHRTLLVSGPLRSLTLLAPQFAQRTQWQALELRVGAGNHSRGLDDSALELTLQGVVYENAPI